MHFKQTQIPLFIFVTLIILETALFSRFYFLYKGLPTYPNLGELSFLLIIHFFLLLSCFKDLYREEWYGKFFIFKYIIKAKSIYEYYFFIFLLSVFAIIFFVIYLVPKNLNHGTGVKLDDILYFLGLK